MESPKSAAEPSSCEEQAPSQVGAIDDVDSALVVADSLSGSSGSSSSVSGNGQQGSEGIQQQAPLTPESEYSAVDSGIGLSASSSHTGKSAAYASAVTLAKYDNSLVRLRHHARDLAGRYRMTGNKLHALPLRTRYHRWLDAVVRGFIHESFPTNKTASRPRMIELLSEITGVVAQAQDLVVAAYRGQLPSKAISHEITGQFHRIEALLAEAEHHLIDLTLSASSSA